MSKGRLKPQEKECIQENFILLKEHVNASDIVDELFTAKVFTLDDKEEIQNQHKLSRQAGIDLLLCKVLQTKVENGFQAFMKALQKDYTEIHELLESWQKARFDKQERLNDSNGIDQTKTKVNKSEKKIPDTNMDIDILLIGKTGNGKSTTGNSVLGRDVFEYSDHAESCTCNVQHEYGWFENRTIKVVDGPGVEDTENMKDLEKATLIMIDKMQDAVLQHTNGYHAFLLVVKYGGRFTMEDKKVIEMLKKIFGQNIVKDYCILIMTYGDNYRSHKANKDKRFKDWCSEQKGVLKELMEECGNRVVLFNNNTENKAIQNKQRKKLFKVIDNLQYSGRRYCDHHFQAAEEMRKRLRVECKEPQITEEIIKECSVLLERSRNVSPIEEDDDQFTELENLFKKSEDLKNEVLELDQGTRVLTTAIDLTNQLHASIVQQIHIFNINMMKLAMEKKKEQITKDFEEKMEKFKEESKEENTSIQKELQETIEQLTKTFNEKIAERECSIKKEENRLDNETVFHTTNVANMHRNLKKLRKEMIKRQTKQTEPIEKTSPFGERFKNLCKTQ